MLALWPEQMSAHANIIAEAVLNSEYTVQMSVGKDVCLTISYILSDKVVCIK